MKNILLLFLISITIASCGNKNTKEAATSESTQNNIIDSNKKATLRKSNDKIYVTLENDQHIYLRETDDADHFTQLKKILLDSSTKTLCKAFKSTVPCVCKNEFTCADVSAFYLDPIVNGSDLGPIIVKNCSSFNAQIKLGVKPPRLGSTKYVKKDTNTNSAYPIQYEDLLKCATCTTDLNELAFTDENKKARKICNEPSRFIFKCKDSVEHKFTVIYIK